MSPVLVNTRYKYMLAMEGALYVYTAIKSHTEGLVLISMSSRYKTLV